jgi:hypothetical protein
MAEGKRICYIDQVGGSFRSLVQARALRTRRRYQNILKDLANQRPVPKDLIGHPELFRDNGPLERAIGK